MCGMRLGYFAGATRVSVGRSFAFASASSSVLANAAKTERCTTRFGFAATTDCCGQNHDASHDVIGVLVLAIYFLFLLRTHFHLAAAANTFVPNGNLASGRLRFE